MIRWWPWRRRHHDPPAGAAPDTQPETTLDAARSTRRRVENIRRTARDQRAEVSHLADTLRRIREENHLVEIFQESLRDRRRDD